MRRPSPPATAKHPVDVRMPAGGLAAFVSRHGRRFRTMDLRHPFHKLCLVEAGAGRIVHPGGGARLTAPVLLRIPAGRPHRFEDASESRMTLSGLCLMEPDRAAAPAVAAAWRDVVHRMPAFSPTPPLHPLAAAEYQRMIRQVVRENAEGKPHAAAACLVAVAGFLVTLARALRENERREEAARMDGFAASLAWIEERVTQRVSVSELARIAGMSYRAYTGRFHREQGLTLTQYLNRRRVAIAQQRLLETGDIVSSALEAGFGDLSHFYRQFKVHSGCTPAAYLSTRRSGN